MNPLLIYWFWCAVFLTPRTPSDARKDKES
jgi:hypothetical protein